MEPEYLRIEFVANFLGLPRSTCYALVASGELPSVRFGRRGLRIPRRQLAEWAERQLSPAKSMEESDVTATHGSKD
jgi:excisionase family DNA binding protein